MHRTRMRFERWGDWQFSRGCRNRDRFKRRLPQPAIHNFKFIGQKGFFAGVAADFAARRFGNAAWFDDGNGVALQFVFFGHGLSNSRNHFIQIRFLTELQFLDNHQSFDSTNFNRHRRPAD